MSTASNRSSRRRRPSWRLVLAAVIVLATFGSLAVATDALGAGALFDRAVDIIAEPSPDSGTLEAAAATAPVATTTHSPAIAAGPGSTPRGAATLPAATPTPALAPTPDATPAPAPARVPVDVNLTSDPRHVFISEQKDTWCSPSAVQMTLALLGKADTSVAFQRLLQSRVHEWESYSDSHNGFWGPLAMARALSAYGAPGYEVRTYKTRQAALRDAAKAVEATRSPALLLAWWGAHTWVMTGFRANADPAVFANATVDGTYILDPWYPRVSSIWGASDPPGTFQDRAEMIRNYIPWKRPEGRYSKRDGLYVAVVPTVAATPGG